MTTRIAEVVRYRRMLRELVVRDLKLRYEGAALGYLWTLFEPLLLTAVYFVVFSLIVRLNIDNYPVFLILGMLPWTWFSGSINAGIRSLRNQAALVTKVYLPRELVPLSVVIAKTIEYLASLPVLILFLIIGGLGPNWMLLLVPVAWAAQFLLTVGLVLALGAVNVLARDVDRLLTVLLRATFYATPILYPLALALDRIPGWLSVIYWINPLVGIMELYRAPFYPDLFYGWGPVLASLALTGVLLLVGIRTFRRLEPQILKEL